MGVCISATNMLLYRARPKAGWRPHHRWIAAPGLVFNNEQVQLVEENLRHEFRQIDTRVKLVCDAELIAAWPADEPDDSGFFPAPTAA